ncbi:MAG: hypothetical protein ABIH11_04570 [Candidatus Altiarchaeota archaeon]
MRNSFAIFTMLVFLVGCISDSPATTSSTIQSKTTSTVSASKGKTVVKVASFATDKGLYKSKELMNLSFSIVSNRDVGEVWVFVYGIRQGSEHPTNRLDEKFKANLSEGANTLSVSHMLPSCNTCSGIRAGNYTLRLEVIQGKKIIAKASTDIELVQ